MLLTNMDPENREKNEPCIQGVNSIIPKMFEIVACVIPDQSWKFHENLFINFTAMLLTDTSAASRRETAKQSNQV